MATEEFISKAAIYYAYQFEKKRAGNGFKTHIMPPSNVFDLVTAGKQYKHIEDIFKYAIRYIEVKSTRYGLPVDFKILKEICSELKPNIGIPIKSNKYYVYVIFNLGLNKIPYLVVLDSRFIRNHGKMCGVDCITIHRVADTIAKKKMPIYRLPMLTAARKNSVETFFSKMATSKKRWKDKGKLHFHFAAQDLIST